MICKRNDNFDQSFNFLPFCRYGPVQSVKYLPSKDGEVSGPGPVSAVTVAFMDIKSACKALQTQHKLDER